MAIESPKIDKRDFEDLLREIKSLVPFYTPEWKPSEKDVGFALVKIFSHMLGIIIQRLNRAPEKNFIAFLDRLGIKFLPAHPAMAPITFSLSEGAKEHVLIPARARVAAGEVVFETEKNMLASPSKLTEAYSINVANDGVYRSPSNLVSGEPVVPFQAKLLYDAKKGERKIFVTDSEGISEADILMIDKTEHVIVSQVSENRVSLAHKLEVKDKYPSGSTVEKITTFELFEGKNLQEHILYLGHKNLFNVKGKVEFRLAVSPKNSEIANNQLVSWQYWAERTNIQNNEETKILDWYDFNFGIEDEKLILEKDNDDEIKERELNKIKSRWIRCKAKDISKTKDISLDVIQIGITGRAELISKYLTLPPMAIRGVGKEFGERLSAADIKTIGKLLLFKDRLDDLAQILSKEKKSFEYYKEKAENILENAQKRILDEEYEGMEIGEVAIQGILPDMAFYNDVPLDLTTVNGQFKTFIYPFGKTPRLLDTFYIASQEAFSKVGATIALQIKLLMESGGSPNPDPALSWEYWDGNGWTQIPGIKEDFKIDASNSFSSKLVTVTINAFPEVKPTKANGQENLWIRVRLIGGHYGQEVIIAGDNISQDNVTPPIITFLSIDYDYKNNFQNVQHLLTHNNLNFIDLTEEGQTKYKVFKPFPPFDDKHQTLYLGFDKKLEKGPVSLFFSIEEQPWSADKIPLIEWEYYTESAKWVRLEVLDETRGLMRSGVIEFVFPQDFKKTKEFGKELYWIRAVDVKDAFKPIKLIYFQLFPNLQQFITAMPLFKFNRQVMKNYVIPAIRRYEPHYLIKRQHHLSSWAQPATLSAMPGIVSTGKKIEKPYEESISEIKPCPELFETFHPEWSYPTVVRKETASPKIKGIFLNTTWAIQAETIKDEILGSSDGTTGQSFTLTKTPIISEEIWINEIRTISEEERKDILEKGEYEARETKDEKGNVIEFWVKWKPVEDLLTSSKDDRHYEIHKVSGEVKFGDGVYGKIPPIGTNNIKTSYRTGGGSKGNVRAYEIKDLKTSIPFLDKAFNPLSASGGTEVEGIEKTIERGPQVLKHRNRAITAEDFEQIAYQASRAIGRAKCISNFDNKGQYKPGWVAVIVIPQSSEDRPRLSLQLKRNIENYLKLHAPLSIVAKNHLQVSEPVYVEVTVHTILTSAMIDAIPIIEKKAFARLREFLHPLTGGTAGRGWEFGRMPCLSDFYALLEKIEGGDHVRSLSLSLRTYDYDRDLIISEFTVTPERLVNIEMPPYAIVYSGVHSVTVQFENAKGG